MGSHSATLKVSERFRPWYQAGVRLLFPGEPKPVEEDAQPQLPEPLATALAGPVSSFPAPWDLYWSKICKTASVAWTYMDLGCDLLPDLRGPQSKERGIVFRNLIQRLQLPAGTSAFWPISEPLQGSSVVSGEPERNPRLDLFWSGLCRLEIQHVICCGSDLGPLLAPDLSGQEDSVFLGPFNLHFVPSPMEMHQNPSLLETAGQILATLI